MANSLFLIAERYSNILELCENAEVPVEMLEEALQEMDGELTEKLENIVSFIKSMNGDIEVIDNEIARLQARKKTINNKITSLKDYTENCLKMLDLKKVKTSLNTISIQNNPPSIEVVDEALIPDEFKSIETVTKIDKKAILKAIKEGSEIAGSRLSQTMSLRIR